MNNMSMNQVAGIQTLSLEEIDEVSGGLSPGMAFAGRVALGLAATGVVGMALGATAAYAIYYFNQP